MKKFLICLVSWAVAWVSLANTPKYVDFTKADIHISNIDFNTKELSGVGDYSLEIIKDTDSIVLDAQNFLSIKATLDGKPVEYNYNDKRFLVYGAFKKGQSHVLTLDWTTRPKKTVYFVSRLGSDGTVKEQIWTQGQGKYTSHWLPSLDDVNDKLEFDLSITYPSNSAVVANGKLIDTEENGNLTTWRYDMQYPMSSYLVAFAIGHYNHIEETSQSGIPLHYYYYPKDSLKVEPTYRHTKTMFDFLEDEIGVDYPWQNYKQVPVKDFLYSGMENTSLTIFSDAFVIDSVAYNDRNYVTVNAHELAHQWFGDMVTATSSEHHWLQEGFATYYALLAERHIFGDNHYYWQLFENAQELIKQDTDGGSTSLLDPKSSSATFYKKGAWALHVLREKVGDSAFKSAVISYLNTHKFKSVETNDFISEVEKASGMYLNEFVEEWLISSTLPEDAMVKSLKKSAFMNEYLEIDCEAFSSKCLDYTTSYISDKAKIKVIAQIPNKIDKRAFKNSLEVRQAIAQYVTKIPQSMKLEYESLLNDRSYATQEFALYQLWVNFPQDRAAYLEKMKHKFGFNNGNIRLLWLALNLNTLEYQTDKKDQVMDELIGYTNPIYNFELRINAFKYLKLIGGFEEQSLKHLLEAQSHHNWQFQQFSKDLLAILKKEARYAAMIEKLSSKAQK